MKNFLKKCSICVLAMVALPSCEGQSVTESIDLFLFSLYGGTVFEKPPMVGLKEIHLDDGRLQGKRLVVEGEVQSVGEYDSYVIIEDKSARMLILLNRIIDTEDTLDMIKKNKKMYELRVLGTVFKGKKGLPYISADSLSLKEKADKGPQT